ncbi:MAG TPA: YihY/virulence factor BrkB family protein, partial [Azospirillaceae bacterium]|nr:YihY/virulence factor BrkB family protein [Azospirillaceae bacterium]
MLGLSRRLHEERMRAHYAPAGQDHQRRARQGDRGRNARRPSELPAPGWRDILWRVWGEQKSDHISIVAAGVAFNAFLAIFPILAAMVSIYGLVADPMMVERQVGGLSGVLPPEAQGMLAQQAQKVAAAPAPALGLSFGVSLLLTLWSASRAITALMESLNIVYAEEEKRGVLAYYGTAFAMTLGAILLLLVVLTLVVAVPAVINTLGLTGPIAWVFSLARWPILAMGIIFGLAVLYRYAPSRQRAQWRWVSWGSAVATGLWLLGSIAFSVYVSNFGSYNETYGSVGAVVVALLWFNLAAWAVLLGGELNAEMEHQTAR